MALFVLTLLTLAGFAAPYTLDDCPQGLPRDGNLQVHGDYCYEFQLFRTREYQEAEDECALNGGTLALVKTAEIQNYLVNEAKNTYNYGNRQYDVWIGLHDKVTEGDYYWEDGTPLGSYENWAKSEGPNNNGLTVHNPGEDCVAISIRYRGEWYDHNCFHSPQHYGASQSYICQYKAVTGGATTTPSVPTPCPPFQCTTDCGMEGYVIDPITGCSKCECNPY